ncbi:sigma 54-interacting transcriptional regulator [Megasphaera paucivorans]|uniref:Transcriptional regulator containing PAS, AAA-type ATPase, and DNA-binding Fis domains n=1 Tax=Megasphaera paucivorans TaxID=349095 RepID=A0A1G9QD96_9FIRM|nr:sigma 54-interacting transcriptional regulator [Megasphaera paucivorans]SDM09054.1 Transcriptional regulator containing PAS, AAA-type ATPase, and DNA-binding Fis domains [Megasphaera paucivorans]
MTKNTTDWDLKTFKNLIDNLHDEIMIFDNNYKLVYLNKASLRHYGLPPEHFIGQNFSVLDNTFWGNSTLPIVYREKKTITRRQITNLGADIITISVPIMDKDKNIQYVVMNVNDLYTINELNDSEKKSIDVTYPKTSKGDYIYSSKVMEKIMSMVGQLAAYDMPCLIMGETGTGKSLLAKYMHNISLRKDKPFVSLNCACINPNLIESELFGYKSGSFTGADKQGKKGLLEIADGGTLFMDEVSEIPMELQSKFLQVLQDQEFIPVGGHKPVTVNVKIIAATNCNLQKLVATKNFRQDLYYRLNAFEIVLPPLRERPDDIKALSYFFLNKYNKKFKRNQLITEETLSVLMNYSWPGNIRELDHIIQKMVVLSTDSHELLPQDLPKNLFKFFSTEQIVKEDTSLDDLLADYESRIIHDAYNKYQTSTHVAKALKISQPKAYRLIKKYIKDTE